MKTGKCPTLTCKFCLSVRSPLLSGPNAKFFRISAFKGSAKNDEPRGRANGSKSSKNSAKLSYVQQESKEFTKSPEIQDVQLSYESEVESLSGSQAIQKLFKNWLTLLRTLPPSNEVSVETVEGSEPEKVVEIQDVALGENRDNILTVIWGLFWGLDATVKVPLLLFIPFYLAINVAYGAQVSKELTPLWILGPLVIALYVKIFQGICALYVFTFKQTVKVIKNSPAYTMMVYTYIADGKLKDEIYARLWQPVLDIKNTDYRVFSARKVKEFQVWAGEKYLDYVESIWPTYCRTIRFLKRANLI